jgi:hypothetical protein
MESLPKESKFEAAGIFIMELNTSMFDAEPKEALPGIVKFVLFCMVTVPPVTLKPPEPL